MKSIIIILIIAILAFLGLVLLDVPLGIVAFLVLPIALFALLIAYLLSGNKKAQFADQEMIAHAKTLIPSTGKGGLYIIRSGFVGMLQGIDIQIASTNTGTPLYQCQLKGGRYTHIELPAGKYAVTSSTKANQLKTTTQNVNMVAGQSVIIVGEMQMGALQNQMSLRVIDNIPMIRKMLDKNKFVLPSECETKN